jgi:hypothetical protein
MKTYFLTFKVLPTEENAEHDLVEYALAHCWIVEESPENAISIASFCVSKYDWIIREIETYPIETIREDFIEKDVGMQCYEKAQEDGIDFVFVAKSKDGKTSGYKEMKPSYRININTFLGTLKKHQNQGRCLHYESDGRCKEIVKAHSIQKQGLLAAIAYEGHVYKIVEDFGALKKNKGKFSCKKVGINKASTFLGFCKRHDNELFEQIDNYPLIPTEGQIFLYAYRSLCREIFVKENILNVFESQLSKGINQEALKDFFSNFREGTAFGLENLRRHKSIYDECLKSGNFQNLKYVLFISKQNPIVAFAGLIYPDFDFMGRNLQDLGNTNAELELITFCSAPVASGWAFLFAWYASNSKICNEYMNSLALICCNGNKIADMLFRLVISNCENHAFSPTWWEGLSELHQMQILERASRMADCLVNTTQSYLMEGLEGIVDWKFDSVISNIQTEIKKSDLAKR